jgi:DNA-directed RNA polymerase specialized sigma subunit
MKATEETRRTGESRMAAISVNLGNPRDMLFGAIIAEIRSWADLPRRIFMQVHYGGKSVEEIAYLSGCSTAEVSQILETHECRLRSALKAFRIV